MKMSIVCGLEVRPRLFEGCEYRRTLSSLGWHQTEDVAQLLDHPSTDYQRAAIRHREATIGHLRTIRHPHTSRACALVAWHDFPVTSVS
jgi:hypothetical protein